MSAKGIHDRGVDAITVKEMLDKSIAGSERARKTMMKHEENIAVLRRVLERLKHDGKAGAAAGVRAPVVAPAAAAAAPARQARRPVVGSEIVLAASSSGAPSRRTARQQLEDIEDYDTALANVERDLANSHIDDEEPASVRLPDFGM